METYKRDYQLYFADDIRDRKKVKLCPRTMSLGLNVTFKYFKNKPGLKLFYFQPPGTNFRVGSNHVPVDSL